MSTRSITLRCRFCKKDTIHLHKEINHGLHFFLTIFTLGIWLTVWIILAIIGIFRSSNHTSTQCTVCGASRAVIE
jgi:hypothetical protein